MDSMEVKHWYYDRCWWTKNYFKAFFAVWTLPFFQHIPGKSFRLKFLMYVWNTFRGHIKLQKHFRWTVWRSNIDIMIDADEFFFILRHFLLLGLLPFLQHIPGKSFRLKFLMYVWNTFRGHIKLQKHFRWTVWRSNIDIMIDADEHFFILRHFLLFGLCHFFSIFQGKVFG